MNSFSLNGKNIVILGGAGLLGSETARVCALAGAHGVGVDIDEKSSRALVKDIEAKKGSASFIKANIADPASLARLAGEVAKKIGRVDGLVHAAYPKTKNYGKPIETADPKDILANLDLQLGGPLLSTRAFMPLLQKQKSGSVVFFSSIYGIAAPRFDIYKGTSLSGVPAEYAGVKGGLNALTRYFASLLGASGVRVNTVSPGGIFAGQPKKFLKGYSQKLLLGKNLLKPSDIAGAVVFLLSDASKQMTGQNLVIDGGWTL